MSLVGQDGILGLYKLKLFAKNSPGRTLMRFMEHV